MVCLPLVTTALGFHLFCPFSKNISVFPEYLCLPRISMIFPYLPFRRKQKTVFQSFQRTRSFSVTGVSPHQYYRLLCCPELQGRLSAPCLNVSGAKHHHFSRMGLCCFSVLVEALSEKEFTMKLRKHCKSAVTPHG